MKIQINWLRFFTAFLFLGGIQAIAAISMRSFVSHGFLKVSPLFFFSVFGVCLILMGISLFLAVIQERIIGISPAYSHIITSIILALLLVIVQWWLSSANTVQFIDFDFSIIVPTILTCMVVNFGTYIARIIAGFV
jgi:hypothetical protein